MMETIQIRKAGRKDIFRIRATLSQAKNMGNTAPPFYFRWVIRQGIVLVAERKGKIAGFLIAERNDKIAYAQLIYLFVHPMYRGKGIGSELMREFLKACRKKGVKYIDVHAQAQTAGFYRRFGFRKEGKFVAMYREGR